MGVGSMEFHILGHPADIYRIETVCAGVIRWA